MKKAVVTLLGMISHSKLDYISVDGEVKKIFIDIPEKERAKYSFSENLNEFSEKLSNTRYINTLPLLIDGFSDREIIPIATQKAKDIQEKTLNFLKINKSCLDNTVIINESKYEEIFQQISELLQNDEYESFIIDLTHGFRHLPILMIVNLIIASMKENDKIEHIFFAKEIISMKEYKIIDLLDYIGLAKLSFVLENFNTNYTVGNKLIFRNKNYQELVDNLRIISGHILANSIKALIDGDNNLIKLTIEKLQKLQEDDIKVETFSNSINNIIEHLEKIEILGDEEDYIRLFRFAKVMQKRDYLLNSITLLNESVGMFCVRKLKNMGNLTLQYIENYQEKITKAKTDEDKKEFNIYKLSHQSKNIIKLKNGFKGNFLLSSPAEKKEILQNLNGQNNTNLITIIKNIEDLRNNLAHGNSSDGVKNVKHKISTLLREYQKLAQISNSIDLKEKENEFKKKELEKTKNPKVKIIPTGIDAPEAKVNDLENMFNNR